jgi:predicted lipid-binding transport protein (Tim44 family)
VLIIIVVFVIISAIQSKNKKGGPGGTSGGDSGGGAMPPSMPAGDPYAEIKAADPDFNAEMFQGRVNEMFVAIQYAWMNRNMEPVRRFLSDQQFSVLNNSVQTDYIAKGQINKLDNVHITQMWPVEVIRQGEFDSVKMLIEAACIDYTIDERTGQIVNPAELGDGKTPTTFQEYWWFMRKAGVASKMDATIQKCPNCGAPVTDGNYVKCAYCGVQLNDPTLDWVLMRIEQV